MTIGIKKLSLKCFVWPIKVSYKGDNSRNLTRPFLVSYIGYFKDVCHVKKQDKLHSRVIKRNSNGRKTQPQKLQSNQFMFIY